MTNIVRRVIISVIHSCLKCRSSASCLQLDAVQRFMGEK